MAVTLRDARPADPGVPELLYVSAAGHYDRYFGTRDRAVALIRAAYPRPRHVASFAVSRVAEIEGRPAGVAAAFSVADLARLSRRFAALTGPCIPPWHWLAAVRTTRVASRLTPPPPDDAWYVDALAVASWARRAGVAQALLADAEAQARAAGHARLALDTGLDNAPARALYESAGFEAHGVREDRRAATVIGAPGLVAYARAL